MNAIHIALIAQTQRGSEIFLEKKWQMIKEEKVFRKL